MDSDVLARVFQPFFTTREKGTGLGLPLGRRIAERHGGTLTLHSQPGEGTEAVLAWPLMARAVTVPTPDIGGTWPADESASAGGVEGSEARTDDDRVDPDDGLQMIG
jgi:hypothetical protein